MFFIDYHYLFVKATSGANIPVGDPDVNRPHGRFTSR